MKLNGARGNNRTQAKKTKDTKLIIACRLCLCRSSMVWSRYTFSCAYDANCLTTRCLAFNNHTELWHFIHCLFRFSTPHSPKWYTFEDVWIMSYGVSRSLSLTHSPAPLRYPFSLTHSSTRTYSRKYQIHRYRMWLFLSHSHFGRWILFLHLFCFIIIAPFLAPIYGNYVIGDDEWFTSTAAFVSSGTLTVRCWCRWWRVIMTAVSARRQYCVIIVWLSSEMRQAITIIHSNCMWYWINHFESFILSFSLFGSRFLYSSFASVGCWMVNVNALSIWFNMSPHLHPVGMTQRRRKDVQKNREWLVLCEMFMANWNQRKRKKNDDVFFSR